MRHEGNKMLTFRTSEESSVAIIVGRGGETVLTEQLPDGRSIIAFGQRGFVKGWEKLHRTRPLEFSDGTVEKNAA